MTISGTCHCGGVEYEFNDTPDFAIRCNCSICRRLGTLWIYADPKNVIVKGKPSEMTRYMHGDKDLSFQTCKTCGTTVSWEQVNPSETKPRMAVNLNLADLDVIKDIPVRLFDGADTWEFYEA